MASNKADVLIFPDCKITAPRFKDVDMWSERRIKFPTKTLLGSELRITTISMPAGLTDNGLPVGLEILGLPYAEQGLLELAFGVEMLVKGRQSPRFNP